MVEYLPGMNVMILGTVLITAPGTKGNKASQQWPLKKERKNEGAVRWGKQRGRQLPAPAMLLLGIWRPMEAPKGDGREERVRRACSNSSTIKKEKKRVKSMGKMLLKSALTKWERWQNSADHSGDRWIYTLSRPCLSHQVASYAW